MTHSYLRTYAESQPVRGTWTILAIDSTQYWTFQPYDGRRRRERIDRVSHEEYVTRAILHGCGQHVPTTLEPGDYHPRVWRGQESPTPEEAKYRSEWISCVRAGRSLFFKLRELFHHTEPSCKSAYGQATRELLILACTEVESAWRSVLKVNQYSAGNPNGRWTTSDYVKLLQPMHLNEWVVKLSSHPDYGDIAPFKDWSAASPTPSLPWYDAYNATKHAREEQLFRATLETVVDACAAVFIMTLAQFGDGHLAKEILHPDEFRVEREPGWPLDEQYIAPGLMIDPAGYWEPIGAQQWKPSSLQL